MQYERNRLIELVKREALSFGDFTLASGQKSGYYIDCRKVTLSSEGAALIAAGILDLLGDSAFDSIGGLTLGADPIIAAVLVEAHTRGRSLRGLIVRKETKQHGTGRQIEGPFGPGDRVVVVEDVTTSGGSALAAIDAIESAGGTVVHVVSVIDRLAGARGLFSARGYPFSSLLSLVDLGL